MGRAGSGGRRRRPSGCRPCSITAGHLLLRVLPVSPTSLATLAAPRTRPPAHLQHVARGGRSGTPPRGGWWPAPAGRRRSPTRTPQCPPAGLCRLPVGWCSAPIGSAPCSCGRRRRRRCGSAAAGGQGTKSSAAAARAAPLPRSADAEAAATITARHWALRPAAPALPQAAAEQRRHPLAAGQPGRHPGAPPALRLTAAGCSWAGSGLEAWPPTCCAPAAAGCLGRAPKPARSGRWWGPKRPVGARGLLAAPTDSRGCDSRRRHSVPPPTPADAVSGRLARSSAVSEPAPHRPWAPRGHEVLLLGRWLAAAPSARLGC